MTTGDSIGAVLVVGGGIGGMQAALDLAEAGFKVYLAERQSAIGGRMVQLDKTFPTNDCSMCTISPRLVQVGQHPNIVLLTDTTLKKLEGHTPHFSATMKYHARYIDPAKCTACGDCEAVCPVNLPRGFDLGLGTKHAIFKLYPQATPNAYAIDKLGTASCRQACPAHVSSQGYVALVRAGKYHEALTLIKRDLPLPSICGRVCAHPCEDACRRGAKDSPVSIRALKRFVTEIAVAKPAPATNPSSEAQGRVAVIGSGPAGLTAAHFLALSGHRVTIFEALGVAGGMMRTGVPAYRLPREVIQRDIDGILALGINLETHTRLGRDFTLDDLFSQGFQAVFVGTGLHRGRALGIEGETLSGVWQGVEFLKKINLDENVTTGKRVAVIGGGNVAVDVARTALRLGASEVTMVCLEQPHEMPAHPEEVEESLEEGIKIINSFGPKRISSSGRKLKLALVACTACFDENGRFNPRFDESITKTMKIDTVIAAIGQTGDTELITSLGLASSGDRIEVDPITLQTTLSNVFAGGDAVMGPRSVIEAVAQGKRAAAAIEAHLRGRRLDPAWPHLTPEAAPGDDKPIPVIPRHWETKRPAAERKKDFDEISSVLTDEAAQEEASRCLSCAHCSECYQCESVCQANAICHLDNDREFRIEVGAVIAAPGFEEFDVHRLGEYGYGIAKNVVTSLEMERLLSSSGPFAGHLRRPSDQAVPRRIAWLQCVGSRDERGERPFCSSVCCMLATKQAVIIKDHFENIDTTVFHLDIRAFGKGFEGYYNRARDRFGVRYTRAMISKIDEVPEDNRLEIRYRSEDGTLTTEVFDMVVLSTGLKPSASVIDLAAHTGIALDQFGFAWQAPGQPNRTSRPGVHVAGVIGGPRDIPETVVSASSAAALAAADIAEARGTAVTKKQYPAEREVSSEIPRVGVFVCRCGTNIARVVDVPTLTEYAATLNGVVLAEENLYTCSADTQRRMADQIQKHQLNRIVVASCTPRTHEPLFRETLRDAGLNQYLFEMANIRDQCAWVHAHHTAMANEKAKDLVRMAVARAKHLSTLQERALPVTRSGLVVGGGVAGLTAALSLADQGFDAIVLEKDDKLGGTIRNVKYFDSGEDPQRFLASLVEQATKNSHIRVITSAELVRLEGHVGQFASTVRVGIREERILHGTIIVATGAAPYLPAGEYGHGANPRVITQPMLETMMESSDWPGDNQTVVMIQCVGSRRTDFEGCSRICCTQAVSNAYRIKARFPTVRVVVLYRDIRTYGMNELLFRQARREGVLFVRFEPECEPVVNVEPRLTVRVKDLGLNRVLAIDADWLVLGTGMRPRADAKNLAGILKIPLSEDGFFQEAHMKLRPLDTAKEGLFLAGFAHGPKRLDETIAQAQGAAARAATVLSKDRLMVSAEVSRVNPDQCAGCLTCVRTCPFGVPVIGVDRVAQIEAAICQGCGVCASACPRKAISTSHATDAQIMAKIDALFYIEGDQL